MPIFLARGAFQLALPRAKAHTARRATARRRCLHLNKAVLLFLQDVDSQQKSHGLCLWWFMVVYGGLWWFLVVYVGLC